MPLPTRRKCSARASLGSSTSNVLSDGCGDELQPLSPSPSTERHLRQLRRLITGLQSGDVIIVGKGRSFDSLVSTVGSPVTWCRANTTTRTAPMTVWAHFGISKATVNISFRSVWIAPPRVTGTATLLVIATTGCFRLRSNRSRPISTPSGWSAPPVRCATLAASGSLVATGTVRAFVRGAATLAATGSLTTTGDDRPLDTPNCGFSATPGHLLDTSPLSLAGKSSRRRTLPPASTPYA